ncbi:MAG: hypothetical protein WAT66_14760 [Actinomycetota bacterium]
MVVTVASGVWYWTLLLVDASRRDDKASKICQPRVTSGEVRKKDLHACLRSERKRILGESPFLPYFLGPVILGGVAMTLFIAAFVHGRPLMRNRNDGTVDDR